MKLPDRRWWSLATDFIMRLPMTKSGHDSITISVDLPTSWVYFLKSKMWDTPRDCLPKIFKNHGVSDDVTLDRDGKFVSKFRNTLINLCGVKVWMSNSRQPRTDSASKIMNRMIENYLCCFCSNHQDDCDKLLPSAEFEYNSAVRDDMGISSFGMDLGKTRKLPLDFFASSSIPIHSLNNFWVKLKDSLDDTKYAYKVAKAR